MVTAPVDTADAGSGFAGARRARDMVRAALLIALLAWPVAGAEPIPLEAAFDRTDIMAPAVFSPDGRRFALEVRRKPPDFDVTTSDERFLASGKPPFAVGGSVLVFDRDGGAPEDVLDEGDAWRPSWSPDGSKLAFYSDADGVTRLWVFDVATGRSRRISDASIKARVWPGAHARWSPDGRFLFVPVRPADQRSPAAAEAREPAEWPDALHDGARVRVFGQTGATAGSGDESGSVEADPLESHFLWMNNAHLARISLETGAVDIVAAADSSPRPSVLRLSPSGRWLSYLSVFHRASATSHALRHDIVVMPSDGAESDRDRLVVSEDIPVAWPYYERAYRWAPDEDRLVYFRDDGLWGRDFRHRRPGRPKRLARDLDRLDPATLLFSADGREVLVAEAADRGGDLDAPAASRFHLVSIDSGESHQIPFNEARWRLVSFVAVDGSVLWQPDRDLLTAHARDRENGDHVLLQFDRSDGAWAERFRWDGRMSSINGIEGGGVSAVLERLDVPPAMHLFDQNLASHRVSTRLNPQLADVDAGSVHDRSVMVPAPDGNLREVTTSVLLPPGAEAGDAVPALIVQYPGSDLTTLTRRFLGGDFHVPWGLISSRGYAVVFTHTLIGPPGEPGQALAEITDSLLPQVYALADAGYIDAGRLALTGNSFGGYAAAGVTARTNLFRATIPHNGPYDLGGANYGAFDNPLTGSTNQSWLESDQPRIGAHPWADLRRVIDNSPYYQADRMRTPMLIMQGGADDFLREAQMLYTALSRLDQTVELAVYEESGHVLSSWPRANAIDGVERMLAFMETHIGPGFAQPDDD